MSWKSKSMNKFLAIAFLGILSIAAFATTKDISGTWQASVDGKLNASMKLIFTPQGAFKFVGSGYSSCGTYKLEGDTIQLNWTSVDGQSITPGTMKRTVTLAPDNTFSIDRFAYSRRA